jgi:hypothetical protein
MKTIFFRSTAAAVSLIAISFLVRAQSALPYVLANGAVPAHCLVVLHLTLQWESLLWLL